MNNLYIVVALTIVLASCQDNDTTQSDFTGNEATYPLVAGSAYPINGMVTFKEKKDGSTLIKIDLEGTEGNIQHPVHLHLGNISAPDAAVSALLNPVIGKTGVSETALTRLADESSISYADLIKLNACIKVHLSDVGTDKDVVLAGGNIGQAADEAFTNGRTKIGVCSSDF